MASTVRNIGAKAPAAANNNVFTLDDGTREITLVNPFGRVICTLHIRTSDISIFDRYNDLIRDLDSIVQPLKALSINADGTSTLEEDMQQLKAVENIIKRKIDVLLDADGEAEAIFATRNPFSSVGGQFFVERVLEVLGNVIAQGVQDEAKKAKERMAKYLTDITPADDGVTADAGAASDNS